jgi:arylsulfatase A-like enzyme
VIPRWLKESGYETAFVGKYLNGYGRDDLGGDDYVPPGWTEWYGLTAETKKSVFDYEINRNGKIEAVPAGERSYKTDVLARIGARVITRAAGRPRPLFLWVATSAPHVDPALEDTKRNPAPAQRHRGEFEGQDVTEVAGPAYNERDVSDKPGFVRKLPRFKGKAERVIEKTYVSQLESLLAVDELVGTLVRSLRTTGQLENTIFVFTSDNGFLRGQHRIDSGKAKFYEESIRVPLLVRGPGFPEGVTTDNPVANVDLAATFMRAAGVRSPEPLDGVPLTHALRKKGKDRDILLEVFSRKADQFRGVRSKKWAYAEREGDVAELYDLRQDPFQLDNLAKDSSYRKVRAKLASRLRELEDCVGADCR